MTVFFDSKGKKVNLIRYTRSDSGRFSSLGGWYEGGDIQNKTIILVNEDGEDVSSQIVSSPDGEFKLEQPRHITYPNGTDVWVGGGLRRLKGSSATSTWLPDNCYEPKYRDPSTVAADWQAAEKHKKDQELFARINSMSEEWRTQHAWLIELFCKDPDSRYGGWGGKKHSVREHIQLAIEEEEKRQAEEAAARAASPFAILATIKKERKC